MILETVINNYRLNKNETISYLRMIMDFRPYMASTNNLVSQNSISVKFPLNKKLNKNIYRTSEIL